jgi:hypothetical protein
VNSCTVVLWVVDNPVDGGLFFVSIRAVFRVDPD